MIVLTDGLTAGPAVTGHGVAGGRPATQHVSVGPRSTVGGLGARTAGRRLLVHSDVRLSPAIVHSQVVRQ